MPPTSDSTVPSRVAPSAFGPTASEDTDTDIDEDDESPAHRAFTQLNTTSDAGSSGSGKTQSANNAWYFIAGSDSERREDNPPAESEDEQLRRLVDPKRAVRPKDAQYLVCLPCHRSKDGWKAWKNGNGQVTNIVEHLERAHWQTYRSRVIAHGLKHYEELLRSEEEKGNCRRDRPAFTVEGFRDRLLRFTTVFDQSMNAIECAEFRDLLLFLCAELEEEDIPHRTLLTQLIVERFEIEKERMKEDIRNAAGRVSYTADVWSRANMQPFLAVTAHYIVRNERGHLEERHRLVAFRHIQGTHDGKHLAEVFLAILDDLSMAKRMGAITLDNASNNNTLMEWLEKLLVARGIYFDRDGNRIRCFPHVVNIAVKTGVKYMTKDSNPGAEATEEQIHEDVRELFAHDDFEYADILNNDPIGKVRTLSNWFRTSAQRREALKAIIVRGNAILRARAEQTRAPAPSSSLHPSATAPDPSSPPTCDARNEPTGEDPIFTELLALVTLLRDVDTRWSSMYLMILRLLELYPAVKYVLQDPKHARDRHLLLRRKELKVLKDITIFLELFHKTQELLSANRTPTLAYAIPAYELLLQGLNAMKQSFPGLRHAIIASERKLIEYLSLCRRSRLYALAMGINPSMKLEWAHAHWSREDYETARSYLRDAMLEKKRAIRREAAAKGTQPQGSRAAAVGASTAARAQGAGFSGLASFVSSLSSICSQDDTQPAHEEDASASRPESPCSDNPSPEVDEAAATDAQDIADVEDELEEWMKRGTIKDENQRANLDLVRSWDHDQYEFPIIFQVALDVLPVQASAVPCERAFSSSKETDALRRASLSPKMMECLQVLKYIYREDRLDMTEGLLAREEELEAMDIDPSLYDELLVSGRYEELVNLIDSNVYTKV